MVEYLCCMLIGHADFVRRNPIATKRVVRAMIRATEFALPSLIGSRSGWSIVGSRPFMHPRVRASTTSPTGAGRYDPEVGFASGAAFARARHDQVVADKIIATEYRRRFINEVRKELGV